MSKLLAYVILLAAPIVYAAQYGCVGDCANGTGTYYYAAQSFGEKPGDRYYEGEWKDGKRHGRGTYYIANGDRYEGEWKRGERNVRLTWYFTNGDRYEGDWKDGKRDGQGAYYFSNGDRHVGWWKDNKPNGRGTYYSANGHHFKGEWVDGERTKVEVCVLSVCFAVVPWIYDVIDFAVVAAPWAAIVVAAFLIFYGVRRRYESKRSEALRSVALSLGMSFEDGRNIDATQRFGPFHLFSQGSEKKVRNCLSGTIDGVDLTTFGYEYTLAGAETSSTVRQTVIVFRSNELSLPEFELRPRSIVETFKIVKVFKALVGRDEDIKFDIRPDFSKSYYLGGKDESAIRGVFSHSVLEYFERHQGLSVEGRDGSLLCYRGETLDADVGFRGARVRPDELKRFLDEGRAVFDLFSMKRSMAVGADSDVKKLALFDPSKQPWRPRVSGVVGFLFGPLAAGAVSFTNLRRLGSPRRANWVLLATVLACLLIGFLYLPVRNYANQQVQPADLFYGFSWFILWIHIGNLLSPFVYPILQWQKFEDWRAQEQQRPPANGWSAAFSAIIGFLLFYPLTLVGVAVGHQIVNP